MRDITPYLPDDNYMDAILKLVPEPLAKQYELCPAAIRKQDQITLRTYLRPPEQLEVIRTKLWKLLGERLAVPGSPRISVYELAKGLAPVEYIESVCGNNHIIAWIMIPVINYDDRLEALLDRAYDKLEEILELPIKDVQGKTDLKTASLVLQVIKHVDMRNKGDFTQRIEEKSLTLHGSAKDAKMLGLDASTPLDEIERRIRELEGKPQVQEISTTIEVTGELSDVE